MKPINEIKDRTIKIINKKSVFDNLINLLINFVQRNKLIVNKDGWPIDKISITKLQK